MPDFHAEKWDRTVLENTDVIWFNVGAIEEQGQKSIVVFELMVLLQPDQLYSQAEPQVHY